MLGNLQIRGVDRGEKSNASGEHPHSSRFFDREVRDEERDFRGFEMIYGRLDNRLMRNDNDARG